jgi:hypothetical protein
MCVPVSAAAMADVAKDAGERLLPLCATFPVGEGWFEAGRKDDEEKREDS